MMYLINEAENRHTKVCQTLASIPNIILITHEHAD